MSGEMPDWVAAARDDRTLAEFAADFEEAAGETPAEFMLRWKGGLIEDTAQNAGWVVEAMSYLAAVERAQ